jgi:hypothetical protein
METICSWEKCPALRCALHLDDIPAAGHDDVHIHIARASSS